MGRGPSQTMLALLVSQALHGGRVVVSGGKVFRHDSAWGDSYYHLYTCIWFIYYVIVFYLLLIEADVSILCEFVFFGFETRQDHSERYCLQDTWHLNLIQTCAERSDSADAEFLSCEGHVHGPVLAQSAASHERQLGKIALQHVDCNCPGQVQRCLSCVHVCYLSSLLAHAKRFACSISASIFHALGTP